MRRACYVLLTKAVVELADYTFWYQPRHTWKTRFLLTHSLHGQLSTAALATITSSWQDPKFNMIFSELHIFHRILCSTRMKSTVRLSHFSVPSINLQWIDSPIWFLKSSGVVANIVDTRRCLGGTKSTAGPGASSPIATEGDVEDLYDKD